MGLDKQMELIHELPSLLRQHVTGSAHVFSGCLDRKGDTATRLVVGNQKFQHILLATSFKTGTEQRLRIQNIDHDVPGGLCAFRNIHDQMVIGLNQPRSILRSLQVTRHPIQPLGDAGEHAHALPSTIQVSLLPPPCEELTTREPFLSATRVSPPGVTQVFLLCRIKGLRSK